MTKTIVLALAGTGFPDSADPITQDFFDHLDSSHYETRVVPYPSSFGGSGPSFAVSRAAGETALWKALQELNGAPVVLAGYSQGAVIAGDVARNISEGNWASGPMTVKAVALIADGYRPRGVGLVPPGQTSIGVAEGYGIAGERVIPEHLFPVFHVSAWGDPISSLPAGNPLRSVADLVEWYSLRSPAEALQWGAAMLDTVVQRRLQQWWLPANWGRWNSAIAFARGYLFDGRHTTDYIFHDYTRTLAGRLNELATTGS
jgi:hypothetical protein